MWIKRTWHKFIIMYSLLLSIGIIGTLRIQMLWREWSKLWLELFQMYRYDFDSASVQFLRSCVLGQGTKEIKCYNSGCFSLNIGYFVHMTLIGSSNLLSLWLIHIFIQLLHIMHILFWKMLGSGGLSILFLYLKINCMDRTNFKCIM